MLKRAILLLTLSGLIYEAHGIEIPETPVKIGTYDLAVAINSPVGKEMLYERHLVETAAQQLLNDLDLDVIIEKKIVEAKFPTLDVTPQLIEAIIRLKESAVPQD